MLVSEKNSQKSAFSLLNVSLDSKGEIPSITFMLLCVFSVKREEGAQGFRVESRTLEEDSEETHAAKRRQLFQSFLKPA